MKEIVLQTPGLRIHLNTVPNKQNPGILLKNRLQVYCEAQ